MRRRKREQPNTNEKSKQMTLNIEVKEIISQIKMNGKLQKKRNSKISNNNSLSADDVFLPFIKNESYLRII